MSSCFLLAVLLGLLLADVRPAATQGCGACGNGVVEGAEECDDGNTTSGDGCSATCQLENTSAICAGVPTVAGTALDSIRVTSGLVHPVHITAPPLDPSRVFVVEQPGRIRVIKNGALLSTPFLAIESKVLSGGERGLLSVAFHPNYEINGLFYVNYTRQTDGATVIAKYQVSSNPDLANAGSEVVLLTIPQPFANHNGGLNVFGPGGFLYVGMGDGGGACDPSQNAQNDASRLGKLLRIDVNTMPVTVLNWAKGLRNPWRFSFDRATGDLYIADVGQSRWEEVDYQRGPTTSGRNYGWDFYEGSHCSSGSGCPDPCPMPPTGLTMPIFEYCHNQTDPACNNLPRGCSITGGFVYRGCRMPDLRGTYFYSDYCAAFIRTFRVAGGKAQSFADRTADLAPGGGLAINAVTSFGEDARGELYIADHGSGAADGEIFKIVPGT